MWEKKRNLEKRRETGLKREKFCENLSENGRFRGLLMEVFRARRKEVDRESAE